MESGVLGRLGPGSEGDKVLGQILKDGFPSGCLQPSLLWLVQAWEDLAHRVQLVSQVPDDFPELRSHLSFLRLTCARSFSFLMC